MEVLHHLGADQPVRTGNQKSLHARDSASAYAAVHSSIGLTVPGQWPAQSPRERITIHAADDLEGDQALLPHLFDGRLGHDDRDVDEHGAFSEKVRGNPPGRDVPPHRPALPPPCRIEIDGAHDRNALFVPQVEVRHQDVAGLQRFELHFDPDSLTDIDRVLDPAVATRGCGPPEAGTMSLPGAVLMSDHSRAASRAQAPGQIRADDLARWPVSRDAARRRAG